MNRLTKYGEDGNATPFDIEHRDYMSCLNDYEKLLLTDALNGLAKYEDLEEQGRLIRLPCKVGRYIHRDMPRNGSF